MLVLNVGLRKCLPMYITKGERDNTLFRIARAQAARCRSYDDLSRKVLEINREWCRPPLPDWQAEQKAQQAWKYELETRKEAETDLWPVFIEMVEKREVQPSREGLECLVRCGAISQQLIDVLLEERRYLC